MSRHVTFLMCSTQLTFGHFVGRTYGSESLAIIARGLKVQDFTRRRRKRRRMVITTAIVLTIVPIRTFGGFD